MSFSTTTYGLGVMALGSAPAGIYEEVVQEGDELPRGARYLDPVTRDYAQVAGEIEKASPVRQRVMNLLVNEVRTSLAVKGITFPRKHDATTPRTVETEVTRALQGLVDEGAIVLQAVRAKTRSENIAGRLGVVVEYLNVSTNENEEVSA